MLEQLEVGRNEKDEVYECKEEATRGGFRTGGHRVWVRVWRWMPGNAG